MMPTSIFRLVWAVVLVSWSVATLADGQLKVLIANNENSDYARCIDAIPELRDMKQCRSTPCYQNWARSYLEIRDARFQCIRRFGRAQIVHYYQDTPG